MSASRLKSFSSLFLTIFQLENDSVIRGSKSDVWDDMSAIVSQRNGSYLSGGTLLHNDAFSTILLTVNNHLV